MNQINAPANWTRRQFLATTGLALTAGLTGSLTGCLTARKPFHIASVFPSYKDDKTGATVYNLTPGDAQDSIVYQTHPMWTTDMRYFVYSSNGIPHAIDMATGERRPIIEGSGNFSLQWNSNTLYYLKGRDLYILDIPAAFQGKDKGRQVATMPAEYQQSLGGLSVDASGDGVYTGVLLEPEKRWGVAGFYHDGWRVLTSFDFKVGHIQANPITPGRVMFCWETGGDAPQRTWFVDAKEGVARPVYKEVNNEWVTHEAWWGADRVIFTIWPYDDAHTQLPHGVAWTDLHNGPLHVLAQYPAWHTQGSPDGRWALGDDFDRNIWLINMATQERRLLTQGHLCENGKTHPHSSFTPDSKAIVLNSSHFGNDDIFYVPIPAWDSLPKMA